ncbi:IS3 family transposase [Halocella sp. SP3-1]|uniref:IS3 family transposase n=1 Tax=Halocella sp. SP3-1 TaxID=2382161 RepID=UPI000F74F38E|nr:IS3 family transposase [Halocella sp. SP3-1]AZO95747.1 IS3 family transposase [Halocella sp. SP3-1]
MSSKRAKRYNDEFKKQIVGLVSNGKKINEIVSEYDIARSTINKWVKDFNNSESFKAKDNRTDQEKELIKLRKENQHLKMENDIFKASSADNGTKIAVIKANSNKYSISAMCRILKISRSLVYYEPKKKSSDSTLENEIISIFKTSKNNYGTRKIKQELAKKGYQVSRRRIGRITKKYGLVSKYTVKQYKVHSTKFNEEKTENIVNRKFDRDQSLDVVVSDLTYVNVNGKWNYICLILDLFNREIIGYAVGKRKTASLVMKAFSSIQRPLNEINILHTDRGNEFKNKAIDQLLHTFSINRSLSKKGCPYDNAVAEAAFKVVKTEFAFDRIFTNFEELKYELFDYVNWYNNHRIHGSLDYLTPVEYRMLMSEKKVC